MKEENTKPTFLASSKYEKYEIICRLFGRKALDKDVFDKLSSNQAQKGLKKYGTTLKDANLTNDILLVHATEEIVDLIEYFTHMK